MLHFHGKQKSISWFSEKGHSLTLHFGRFFLYILYVSVAKYYMFFVWIDTFDSLATSKLFMNALIDSQQSWGVVSTTKLKLPTNICCKLIY